MVMGTAFVTIVTILLREYIPARTNAAQERRLKGFDKRYNILYSHGGYEFTECSS